jgi:hypothetical protein
MSNSVKPRASSAAPENFPGAFSAGAFPVGGGGVYAPRAGVSNPNFRKFDGSAESALKQRPRGLHPRPGHLGWRPSVAVI